jgi:hypothetical protein
MVRCLRVKQALRHLMGKMLTTLVIPGNVGTFGIWRALHKNLLNPANHVNPVKHSFWEHHFYRIYKIRHDSHDVPIIDSS